MKPTLNVQHGAGDGGSDFVHQFDRKKIFEIGGKIPVPDGIHLCRQ